MFGLRNKKIKFSLHTLNLSPDTSMFITVFKIFIWEGISLDIWSEIKFYSGEPVEP